MQLTKLMIEKADRYCEKSLDTKEEFLNPDYRTFVKEFKDVFIIEHFLPMCGAIWSVPFKKVLKMPIKTILMFFKNHGLLSFFVSFKT